MLLRGAPQMDGAQTQYWGVECSGCRMMIPLAIIAFTPERKVIPYRSTPALFMADCANGHTGGTYSKTQVFPFESPLVLGFRTHPAFR